ncbi:MAG TPA: hypothetical protein DDW27_11700 [Bacteroidales bacterium]|nr:hypothetical protein [Bacteroidales bacterium]
MIRYKLTLYIILMAISTGISGQTDFIPPDPPLLNLVTINELTGVIDLSWEISPSTDVAGYIIYYYYYDPQYQGGGYSAEIIDTVWGGATTFHSISRPFTSFRYEYYVVSAFDNSGRGAGKFSNALGTIFLQSAIDTCNNKIRLYWNNYRSEPDSLSNYSIFRSVGNSVFNEIAHNIRDTVFFYEDFENDLNYCFKIKANLESKKVSVSNKSCLLTKMQRPPYWINADYATVGEDNIINLSFSIDPLSEINSYRLERKTGNETSFKQIHQFLSATGSLLYTDAGADIGRVNYYRLAAINNCGIPVLCSNIASNIVLSVIQDKDEINLKWNGYREWNGGVGSYSLMMDTGEGYREAGTTFPADTLFNIKYSDIMYEVSGREVCFILKAYEGSNPYADPGTSLSQKLCIGVMEVITVPDTFTPDGNGINDFFYPVLSFTPENYHLLITDMRRRKIFESRNFMEKWDGSYNGGILPEGVYLWFLRAKAPSGNTISKTGTITLINNRK